MIYGISGKKGTGKDLIGKILRSKLEGKYEIKKFADKLKDIVCLLIGCSREDLENREFKNKELSKEWWYWEHEGGLIPYNCSTGTIDCKLIKSTPRLLLQRIGTEAMREIIHPSIWINALFADYNDNSSWLITDVRFENECKAIKDKGGILIRVNRESDVIDNHPSETALDDYNDWDLVIDNDSDIPTLIEKLNIINTI